VKDKIYALLLMLILCLMMPVSVSAAGSISTSAKNLGIKKGGTATFTIVATNAVGKVDISSSNTNVATVSITESWMDNNSISVSVKGLSTGNAVITVKLSDAATYDEEELNGSYKINVTVTEKSNNSETQNSSNSSNSVQNNEIKNDATLSSLNITDYVIDFDKNKTDYSIDVNNDIVSLEIKAVASASSSKISINGNDHLKVGDNQVVVKVTAKDGTMKNYKINVNRKDEIPETTINKIDRTLKNTTKDTIAVNLENKNDISKDIINKIKESEKNVIFRIYNNDSKLLYFWEFDNNNINELDTFNSTLEFTSENVKDILKLTNYSEMLNLNFLYSGDLPSGTKITIYVGDRFEDGENLNLYYYNIVDKKMDLEKKNLLVENGYVEIEMNHCSEYILTRALLNSSDYDSVSNIVWIIISIIEFILLVGFIIFSILKRKKDIA